MNKKNERKIYFIIIIIIACIALYTDPNKSFFPVLFFGVVIFILYRKGKKQKRLETKERNEIEELRKPETQLFQSFGETREERESNIIKFFEKAEGTVYF